MRLRDVMKTRVEAISANETAEAAANRMRSARIRHLVVQDGKKIVGVVSDRDIGRLGSFRQIQTVEEPGHERARSEAESGLGALMCCRRRSRRA